MPSIDQKQAEAPELRSLLAAHRSALIAVAVASGMVNILALTGSIFMMQVYDRVIPGRSVPTLLALGAITIVLYTFQGVLDATRSRILARVGFDIERSLAPRVFDIMARLPFKGRRVGDGGQPLRDLDQVRGFLASQGPTAFFDLPWIPLYLSVCFIFHLWVGLWATAGAIVLVSLTLLTNLLTKQPAAVAANLNSTRTTLAEAGRRNAEVMQGMGFRHRIAALWVAANHEHGQAQQSASDVAASLSALSRTLRMMLQSTLLGLGAYLVINEKGSGGIMFASSIMMSRALAPVELSIANWRTFLAARGAWSRLKNLLTLLPLGEPRLSLPAPREKLVVSQITLTPPGGRQAVIENVGFGLAAGQGLAIIGPSAAGKSSLARALVGIWTPIRGEVRLDGATLEQYPPDQLGMAVGYLPQNVELFDASIAENISRFDPNASDEAVIAAAQAAGVHEMILGLSDGYTTKIGEAGEALSAGQRQRLGLARALYEDPFLVVLDEPNANLDAAGEEALARAVRGVRTRGGIVVVIAHRPSALSAVDMVLVLGDRRQQAFGPRDEVLSKVLKSPAQAQSAA